MLQVKACPPGVELALSRRGKTPTPDTMLIPKKNRKEVYKYLFKGEHSPELLIVGADIITVDRMCRAMTMHGSPQSYSLPLRHRRCQNDGDHDGYSVSGCI